MQRQEGDMSGLIEKTKLSKATVLGDDAGVSRVHSNQGRLVGTGGGQRERGCPGLTTMMFSCSWVVKFVF